MAGLDGRLLILFSLWLDSASAISGLTCYSGTNIKSDLEKLRMRFSVNPQAYSKTMLSLAGDRSLRETSH